MGFVRTSLARAMLARMKVPRDVARFGFKRYGDRLAVSTDTEDVTFSELERLVLGLVGAWREEGIRKGTSVMSILPDGVPQLVVRLAANEAGVLLSQFPPTVAKAQLEVALEAAPPRLVVAHPDTVDVAERMMDLCPVWFVGDEFDARIARSEPRRSDEPLAPTDLMGIGYTSGTTGKPKAVMAEHGKLVTSMRLVVANVGVPKPGDRPDVFVVGIPLIGAGSGAVMPALMSGSAIVLPPRYRADLIAERVEALRANRTFVTPSTLIDMLELPGTVGLDSLQAIIYGTEQTPAAKVAEALRRFGPILQQGYGSAECHPPVTMLQPDDHVVDGEPAPSEVLSSVGRVVKGVRVRIVDGDGRPLPVGDIGRIDVQSPTVFGGYLDRPDLTAEVLRDGWFLIGDVGRFLPDGRLQVLGREADVLRRSGRTIYPRFVEEIAHGHPGVKETAYVQVGERLVLAVSPRAAFRNGPPGAFVDDLAEFLDDRVATNERPDEIVMFDELPRSVLTKVLRREVRDELAARAA